MTGGVRDTLAAALCGIHGPWERAPAFVRASYRHQADVVLAALSSPEVVRVATEALTEHAPLQLGNSGPLLRTVVQCRCGWYGPEFAAHQWSVLVSALRGER